MFEKSARLFWLILLIGSTLACEKLANTLPTASFVCLPEFGDLETVFVFDASKSFDEETEDWRLKVRWDVDDDGVWDADYSVSKQFGFRFQSEGHHVVRLEVLDAYGGITQLTDTVWVGDVVKDSVMTDPRDGRQYSIVRLYGIWWMAENLHFGSRVEEKTLCHDNGIIEYYAQTDSLTGEEISDAYYTWYETSDYERDEIQGICPDGWHLINPDDLHSLTVLLEEVQNDADYFGVNGSWHLNLTRHGRLCWPLDDWDEVGQSGSIWYARPLPFPKFSAWLVYNNELSSSNDFHNPSWVNNWKPEWYYYTFEKIAMPVRCVKNY